MDAEGEGVPQEPPAAPAAATTTHYSSSTHHTYAHLLQFPLLFVSDDICYGNVDPRSLGCDSCATDKENGDIIPPSSSSDQHGSSSSDKTTTTMMKASILLLELLSPLDATALACCCKAGHNLIKWVDQLQSSARTIQSLFATKLKQKEQKVSVSPPPMDPADATHLIQRVYRGYVYGRKPYHALALYRARQHVLGKDEAELIKFLEGSCVRPSTEGLMEARLEAMQTFNLMLRQLLMVSNDDEGEEESVAADVANKVDVIMDLDILQTLVYLLQHVKDRLLEEEEDDEQEGSSRTIYIALILQAMTQIASVSKKVAAVAPRRRRRGSTLKSRPEYTRKAVTTAALILLNPDREFKCVEAACSLISALRSIYATNFPQAFIAAGVIPKLTALLQTPMDPALFVQPDFPLSLIGLLRRWRHAASALYSLLTASAPELVANFTKDERGMMATLVMSLNHVVEAVSLCHGECMVKRYSSPILRNVRGACGEAIDAIAPALLLLVPCYSFQDSKLDAALVMACQGLMTCIGYPQSHLWGTQLLLGICRQDERMCSFCLHSGAILPKLRDLIGQYDGHHTVRKMAQQVVGLLIRVREDTRATGSKTKGEKQQQQRQAFDTVLRCISHHQD